MSQASNQSAVVEWLENPPSFSVLPVKFIKEGLGGLSLGARVEAKHGKRWFPAVLRAQGTWYVFSI